MSIQPLTPDLAESFGSASTAGALVAEVIEGSPAERAGLQPGDIIRQIDDRSVDSTQALMTAVAAKAPGATIDVAFDRDGSRQSVEVVLAARSTSGQAAAPQGAPAEPSRRLGLRLEPLTPDIARQLGTGARTGLVVAEVASGGPAAEAGLRRGDVILEVAGKAVTAVADFDAAAAPIEAGRALRMRIQRGEAKLYVILEAPASGE